MNYEGRGLLPTFIPRPSFLHNLAGDGGGAAGADGEPADWCVDQGFDAFDILLGGGGQGGVVADVGDVALPAL